MLDTEGYARMIAVTTQLNKPGIELARLEGVHALTDITGFGLAGHCLELARGAGVQLALDWARMPVIPGVAALLAQGCVTGASGRNWESYGAEISLPPGFADADRHLLSDPQTSGGLLVACSPESAAQALAIFHSQGFADAAVIGEVREGRGLTVR